MARRLGATSLDRHRKASIGGTLKAVVQDKYGNPDVMELKDIDRPVIGDDEVLVRVHAAAVNPPDWAGVHGVPYIVRLAFGLRRPKLRVRGLDMAGVVDAVGKNVTDYRVGNEVFGRGVGTFAEYAVAHQEHLVTKPGNITFEQAAGVAMSGLTALQALRDTGGIQPGQRVLIVGAGGGIGTFAVQIAKSFGTEVTGVCSASKRELVRSIGADHVIDYAREDFTRSDKCYDLVLDNVLQHSLRELLRSVDRKGTLVPNGGQFHKRWFASTGVLLIQAPLLSLVVPQRIRVCSESLNRDDLLVLRDLMASGKLTPVVGSTYPLSRAREAITYFGEGHAEGKIVITV
jgi:NADPH:quinone reductase-like Zn-dependent oxidoreductase